MQAHILAVLLMTPASIARHHALSATSKKRTGIYLRTGSLQTELPSAFLLCPCHRQCTAEARFSQPKCLQGLQCPEGWYSLYQSCAVQGPSLHMCAPEQGQPHCLCFLLLRHRQQQCCCPQECRPQCTGSLAAEEEQARWEGVAPGSRTPGLLSSRQSHTGTGHAPVTHYRS